MAYGCFNTARVIVRVVIDEAADDIGLAAGLELLRDALVQGWARGGRNNFGDDRLATRRALANNANIKLAIDGQGKAAGDRCRCHSK